PTVAAPVASAAPTSPVTVSHTGPSADLAKTATQLAPVLRPATTPVTPPPQSLATGDSHRGGSGDAIGDLITSSGGTSHLTTNPMGSRKAVKPVTGAAWMKAQPYDPDKPASATPSAEDTATESLTDGSD